MWAASVTCLQDSEGCCLTYEVRSQEEGCCLCLYHLSVCLYLWISVSVSISVSISLSVSLALCLSVSVSICLFLSLALWLSLSLSLSVSLWLYLSVSLSLSISLSLSVSLDPLCLCPSAFGTSHHAEEKLSPMEGPSVIVLISISPEPDLTPAARQAGGTHLFYGSGPAQSPFILRKDL